MNGLGTLVRAASGGYVLHFDRRIERPAAKVWAALTEPARLKNRLGAVEVELKVGGVFAIRFQDGKTVMTGVILRLEAGQLLEYRWQENDGLAASLVRWSLAAKGPGACRLSLTHALPPGCKAEDAARLGGGWHAFLDAVPDAADGLDAAAPAYDAAARKTLEATYTDRLAEADRAATDGSLRDDGATIVHFERRIDRPPAKVWAALTDPRIVHNWLGAAEIEPRVGGRYVFRFHDTDTVMTGTITAFEPERLLEYSWSENTVAMPPSRARWELAPDGDGCRLVLTHRFDPSVPRADIVPFLGGWEGLLDVLAQASDGAFMPYRPWDLYDVLYRAKYL